MKIPLPELGLDCEKKELKDCPFCGCSTKVEINKYGIQFYVVCSNCRASSANWSRKKRAIDEWNTRTADNEKSFLVIDEEKYAKELFEICEYPNPEKWEETEGWNREVWRKRASIISQKAKSFMRIEKEIK